MILSCAEWLRAPDPPCETDEIVDGELRLVPVRLYPHPRRDGRLERVSIIAGEALNPPNSPALTHFHPGPLPRLIL